MRVCSSAWLNICACYCWAYSLQGSPTDAEVIDQEHKDRYKYPVELFRNLRCQPQLRDSMSLPVASWFIHVARDYEHLEFVGSLTLGPMHSYARFEPCYVAMIRSPFPLDFHFNTGYLKECLRISIFEREERS